MRYVFITSSASTLHNMNFVKIQGKRQQKFFTIFILSFAVFTTVLWYIETTYPYTLLPITDDYHQLIDLKNFKFLKISFPCNKSTFILILVQSSPANTIKRQAIRETWGRNGNHVKILFLLAAVSSKEIQAKIDGENQKFVDILQGSFRDSYRNLTYKHVSALKYGIYHCPQAEYLLKADDDVFVNVPQLIRFLDNLPESRRKKLIFCRLPSILKPIRDRGIKWFVTKEEYPAESYPVYCFGTIILYSRDVLPDLYYQAQKTKYFWIDDVFVTGILAEKIGVPRISAEEFILTSSDLRVIEDNKPLNKNFLFGSFHMTPGGMRVLYNFTQRYDFYS